MGFNGYSSVNWNLERLPILRGLNIMLVLSHVASVTES